MAEEKRPAPQRPVEDLIFNRIPHVAAGVLFFVAAGINIVNVVGRYVFSVPVFWAEEIMCFLVVWTVFLVAGSITYRGAHLNMDLLYSNFTPGWKRLINIVIALTLIVCTSFTAFESSKVVMLHYRNNALTAGTDIPLVIPTSAILFGFTFMAAAAIMRFRSYIVGKFE
jgi:TRAP-type C4-dicarboxylate transport system permease small subunit